MLFEIGIDRRQGLSYVMSPILKYLIIENRRLIKELCEYAPTTEDELNNGKDMYKRYMQIQTILNDKIPEEFKEKIPKGKGPRLSKPSKSELLKKYHKTIKYLQSFNPIKEADQANCVYDKYQTLRENLSEIMDVSALPKLEISPRGGKDENYRRCNRLRIITLIGSTSCHICGFPFTKMLDVHHLKPLYLGGTNEITNFEGVCCNCHRTIHRAITNGHISQEVKDYYSIDPEMLERLEMIVKAGIEG